MPLASTTLGSTLPTTDLGNLNAVVAQCAALYDQALSPAGPLTKMYDNLGSESATVKRTVIYQVGNFPHYLEIGGASSSATLFYQRLYTLAMSADVLPSAVTFGGGVSSGYTSLAISATTNLNCRILFSPNVIYVKVGADGVSGTTWWFSPFSDGNWRGSEALTTFVHIDTDTNGSIQGAYALMNGKFEDGGIPLLPVCCYNGTSVLDYVPLNFFGYYYATRYSFYQDTIGKYYYIDGNSSPYAVFIE